VYAGMICNPSAVHCRFVETLKGSDFMEYKAKIFRHDSFSSLRVVVIDDFNRRCKAAGKENLTFKDVYFMPKMSYEDARLVECYFKEIYSDEHIEDEIFSVTFKKARAKIEYLVKLSVATLPNQSVNLIADKQN